LCNRSAFLEVLQPSVEAARKGVSSALVYVDLDNFKFINDSFGHASGDMVLFEVAALLKDCVRSQDLPASMFRRLSRSIMKFYCALLATKHLFRPALLYPRREGSE
jgi:GGDEF domain-containing protein